MERLIDGALVEGPVLTSPLAGGPPIGDRNFSLFSRSSGPRASETREHMVQMAKIAASIIDFFLMIDSLHFFSWPNPKSRRKGFRRTPIVAKFYFGMAWFLTSLLLANGSELTRQFGLNLRDKTGRDCSGQVCNSLHDI